MIQLQNVTKRIKENTVLDNVSYTFKSGFVYGLYGQNGSGKTMLLRAISGLINLDSGSIFIDGEKLHDKIEFPPETGIVIENMELLPECSAKRNLQMLAKIKNIADEKDIIFSLERVGLDPEAETLAFYADADLDMLHIAADAPERKVIRILNPISSHLTIMRPLLAPSLLNVVVDNLRKGNAEGRLFEMSNIYIPKQLPVTELPEERLHLGFAAWGCEEDFFAVKGAVESFGAAFGVELTVERATDVAWLHPGIAAYILCKGERVGVFGKLANDVTSELKLPKDSRANLNIYLGEIDWVAFHALVPAAIHYQPIPEFAPVQRDLALVAPESMECGTLVTEMQRACKQLTKVELFDIYRGEKLGADKKSMAFSLSFQPADKPLTPDEIDRFVKKILGNLKFKLGIEIRE